MSTQTEIGSTAVAVPDEVKDVDVPRDMRTGVDVNALMMAALEKGEGAVAALEKLVELEGTVAKREAEKIFGQKFAAFRRACPDIPRNKKGAVRDGRSIMYADLETIQPIVDPLLAEHGFFYRFTTEPSKDGHWLIVTCTLQHEAGHAEKSSMPVPMTSIPKASKAQEATGTRTYGKRLALSDVLGISTTDEADGAGPGEKIDDATAEELKGLAKNLGASRIAKLLALFGAETWADLTEHDVASVKRAIQAAAK